MSIPDRDEIVSDIAKLIAGLQVPMSMSMPLGMAIEPWRRLHYLTGPGWKTPEEIEVRLREHLDAHR